MKLRATKKEFKDSNVIKVGYCGLQTLLRNENPIAYSAGVHGWACDYYKVGYNTFISTGYAPIGKSVDYDIVEKYEFKAQEIVYSLRLDYEKEREALAALLEEFIKAVDHA